MSFSRILGQDQPKQIITKALHNDRVAHTYLFYGLESVGKKLSAIEFAKALNCENSGPNDACDRCPSCVKIERRVHPDFFLVEPVKSSPGATEAIIRIDQIRELQKKLGYLPYEGKVKVAVVDSAETMNLQAANTFLKTLEEPPGDTVLILIATNPYLLLPTIVSRCQGVKFHPLSVAVVEQILRKKREQDPERIAEEEIAFRAMRSMGRISVAMQDDILEAGQYRNELLNLIRDVSFDRMDAIFSWSRATAKQSESLQTVLDELLDLLRDLAMIKARGDSQILHNRDFFEKLRPLAAEKKMSSLLKMFDSVHRTKAALSGNANALLSLETMLIQFCQAA